MKNLARILMLTGSPGIGKTRIVSRTVRILRTSGLIVGGVMSREIRAQGRRIGFELIDLATEQRGILASVKGSIGPKLGKYRVNLNDLRNVGAHALLHAVKHSDIVVCDEIGPMELLSPDFRRAVKAVLDSRKPVLGIFHRALRDILIVEIRNSPNVEILEVTLSNRDELSEIVATRVLPRPGSAFNARYTS